MKNERPPKLYPITQKGPSTTPKLTSKRNIIDFGNQHQPLTEEKVPIKQRNTTGAPFVLNNLRQDPSLIGHLSSSKERIIGSFDRNSVKQRGSLNPTLNPIPLLQPRGIGLRPPPQMNLGHSRENSSFTALPTSNVKTNITHSQNNSQILDKDSLKFETKVKEQLQAHLQPNKVEGRRKTLNSESKAQLIISSIETPKISPLSKNVPENREPSPNLTPVSKNSRTEKSRSYFLTNNSNNNTNPIPGSNIYEKNSRTSRVNNDFPSETKSGMREPVSGGFFIRFEITKNG